MPLLPRIQARHQALRAQASAEAQNQEAEKEEGLPCATYSTAKKAAQEEERFAIRAPEALQTSRQGSRGAGTPIQGRQFYPDNDRTGLQSIMNLPTEQATHLPLGGE